MAWIDRKVLALTVAGVILGLLMLSVSLALRTPAFPPLPVPNGFDDFVKAGELARGPISDHSNLSADALRELIVTNAEALRRCRVGLTRTCSVPTEATIANLGQEVPRLAGLKTLAQLLAAEGRLAELENRPGEATRCYAEVMHLGNEISRGGFIIHRLVGIAVEAIGGSRLAKLVPQLSPQEARATLRLLEVIEANAVTWDEVNRNENRFFRHEIRDLRNLVQAVTSWPSLRSTKAATKARHDGAQARLRLLVIELGLRSFQVENGRAPTALGELVPKYLARLPVDPFTGQALVYKPQDTNWLLYSIGPDGVDDGGGSAGRGSKTGDLLYSSPW